MALFNNDDIARSAWRTVNNRNYEQQQRIKSLELQLFAARKQRDFAFARMLKLQKYKQKDRQSYDEILPAEVWKKITSSYIQSKPNCCICMEDFYYDRRCMTDIGGLCLSCRHYLQTDIEFLVMIRETMKQ
jgi:hypothetical protein